MALRNTTWRAAAIVGVSVLCTALLISSIHSYTAKPVFLFLTALTIASTLLGGSILGLIALAASIVALHYFAGPFNEGEQQRLIANLCVDFTFIALITYLRFVGRGREKASAAAVERARELEKALAQQRLQAEELEKALAQVRLQAAALNAAANAIVITDRTGAIVWANPAFTSLTGYSLPEVLGQNPRFLKSAEQDPRLYTELWQTITSGKPWHGELTNRHKSGNTFAEEITITPLSSATTGEITNFIAIKVDVTEQRNAQRALIRSEKLAAMGRLAATIAHEIRNPLTAMTGLLHLVRSSVNDDSARAYLDLITNQVQAVNRIASQTLSFHRENAEVALFSVSDLAHESVEFYQAKAKQHRVQLTARLDSTVSVIGYIGEVRQVLSNLLLNAIEATPAGGKVVLHVREGKTWQNGEGKGCRIYIADTGTGIDHASRDHIFEPFFTTKGEQGTGLGLWVTVGIVRRAGGLIRVRSTRRQGRSGTCFSIFLPPHAAPATTLDTSGITDAITPQPQGSAPAA